MVVGSAYLIRDLSNGSVPLSVAISQWALFPPAAAFSLVGFVVALRRPDHPAGWLMLIIGATWSVGVSPPTQDGSTIAWLTSGAWVIPFGLMGTHLLLRLPNGELPSPRWRLVSRLSTLAMVLTVVGFLFDPSVVGNPVPNAGLAIAGLVGLLLLAGCIVASIASLVVRSRQAGPEERRQIRWIAAGGLVFLTVWLLSFVASIFWPAAGPTDSQVWVGVVTFAGYAAVPIGIGFAILRYRLFDIDVVIRKAVVAGVIVAFFAAVYALVVGGVGAVVGARSTPVLSFGAAMLAAVLFQPVLVRARRFADRVVFGKRATPYEVLSEFGEQLSETYAADDVLPRTAQVLGEGLGADRARVWLLEGGALRIVATWPVDDPDPTRPDSIRTDVRHRGEPLGALSVAMPANDPMDPGKEKLMADLAAHAGLVLRNVRLLEDLRSSRRRLVAAQDEERRKLERNIHDGAQQQLVALAVKARLARQLATRDPDAAAAMLEQIEAETQRALEDLRDLARGIYPPLLADQGLADALRAQARKVPVPVDVEAEGIGRYPQETEAAVYFSVLEALQNVAKYAGASRAWIELREDGGMLTFEAHDDGQGFDPAATGYGTGLQGMADRLAALEGHVEVSSSHGEGTIVRGRIPIQRAAAV